MGGRHQAARPSLVLAVAEPAAALAAAGILAAGMKAAAGSLAAAPDNLKADQESGIRLVVPDCQVFCQEAGVCLLRSQ